MAPSIKGVAHFQSNHCHLPSDNNRLRIPDFTIFAAFLRAFKPQGASQNVVEIERLRSAVVDVQFQDVEWILIPTTIYQSMPSN